MLNRYYFAGSEEADNGGVAESKGAEDRTGGAHAAGASSGSSSTKASPTTSPSGPSGEPGGAASGAAWDPRRLTADESPRTRPKPPPPRPKARGASGDAASSGGGAEGSPRRRPSAAGAARSEDPRLAQRLAKKASRADVKAPRTLAGADAKDELCKQHMKLLDQVRRRKRRAPLVSSLVTSADLLVSVRACPHS